MSRRRPVAWLIGLLLPGLSLAGCAEDPGPTGPVPGLPPTVLGVEPSVVEAGGTATVRGLNFPPDPSAVDVEFAEQPAAVTSASRTSLDVRLPAPSEVPCRPTRRVQLRVSAAGGGDSARHRFSVAPGVSLGPGESEALPGADARIECREFPAVDADYLVSVFNTSRSPSATVGFELRGTTGAGMRDSTASASVTASVRAGHAAPPRVPAALREEIEIRTGHREILEANRRLVQRARLSSGGGDFGTAGPSPGGARASVDRTADVSAQVAPPSEGELVQFRVPDLSQSGSLCENYVEVTGRVAHVTEHAVLVSDTANPIDGQYDDRLREMGNEFESRMWPVLRDNFGDPLRLDSLLNDDGHLYMVFTPEVNDFGNALAFVYSGDFFPRSSSDSTQFACAASDTAEVFYSRAPTRVAVDEFTSIDATAGWHRVLRSTLIHEVKHLVSYAERLSSDLPPETTWLEESTAHVAEELYARRVFGFSQGSNATYDETLYCAVRPGFPECEGSPSVMVSEFVWLAQYMQAIESLGAVDAGRSDAIFRGSGWWLLRWAIDHAPVPEPQFLTAMTAAPETGISNLEARVGRSWPAILSDWTLSLAADDRTDPEVQRPELTVPSWDVRDVFLGLNRDFGSQGGVFAERYPLSIRTRDYGSFSGTVSGLPGGTAAILHLQGRQEVSQLLEIAPLDGGELPPEIGLSVVRLP